MEPLTEEKIDIFKIIEEYKSNIYFKSFTHNKKISLQKIIDSNPEKSDLFQNGKEMKITDYQEDLNFYYICGQSIPLLKLRKNPLNYKIVKSTKLCYKATEIYFDRRYVFLSGTIEYDFERKKFEETPSPLNIFNKNLQFVFTLDNKLTSNNSDTYAWKDEPYNINSVIYFSSDSNGCTSKNFTQRLKIVNQTIDKVYSGDANPKLVELKDFLKIFLNDYNLKKKNLKSENWVNEFPYITFDFNAKVFKFSVYYDGSYLYYYESFSNSYHLSKCDDLVWNNMKLAQGISNVIIKAFEFNEEIFIFTMMVLDNEKTKMKIRISKVDQENLKVIFVKDFEKNFENLSRNYSANSIFEIYYDNSVKKEEFINKGMVFYQSEYSEKLEYFFFLDFEEMDFFYIGTVNIGMKKVKKLKGGLLRFERGDGIDVDEYILELNNNKLF